MHAAYHHPHRDSIVSTREEAAEEILLLAERALASSLSDEARGALAEIRNLARQIAAPEPHAERR